MKNVFIGKSIGRFVSLIAAVCAVACLIGYTVYGVTYDYFDALAFLCLLFAAAAGFAYFFTQSENALLRRVLAFLNVVMVVFFALAFAIMVKNSIYVWADELNNITMYGSRGGLAPVIALIVAFAVVLVAAIVSCFLDYGKAEVDLQNKKIK